MKIIKKILLIFSICLFFTVAVGCSSKVDNTKNEELVKKVK